MNQTEHLFEESHCQRADQESNGLSSRAERVLRHMNKYHICTRLSGRVIRVVAQKLHLAWSLNEWTRPEEFEVLCGQTLTVLGKPKAPGLYHPRDKHQDIGDELIERDGGTIVEGSSQIQRMTCDTWQRQTREATEQVSDCP